MAPLHTKKQEEKVGIRVPKCYEGHEGGVISERVLIVQGHEIVASGDNGVPWEKRADSHKQYDEPCSAVLDKWQK